MPRNTYKTRLNVLALEELADNLQDLIDEINNGVEYSTKELAQESLRYMKKQFYENGLGSHTGVLDLKSYNWRYKKGFVISLNEGRKLENSPINEKTLVVFNEFGTGMRGEGSGELADIYGHQYNIDTIKKGRIPRGARKMWGSEYCESVTTPDTWWYFKNGKWWWSRGAEGKNMFADLVDNLNELAPQKYKILISDLTGKYGRKK